MKAIKILLLTSAVAFGGAALPPSRRRAAGHTSGPAVGTPVEPSTVTQKENPHITGRAAQSEVGGGRAGGGSRAGHRGRPRAQEGERLKAPMKSAPSSALAPAAHSLGGY